jgi:hypothetical protein
MRGKLVALLVHKITDRIRDDLTSSTSDSSIDRAHIGTISEYRAYDWWIMQPRDLFVGLISSETR